MWETDSAVYFTFPYKKIQVEVRFRVWIFAVLYLSQLFYLVFFINVLPLFSCLVV